MSLSESRRIKVLAICGSTRKSSSNLNLIKAIEKLAEKDFSFQIFDGLMEIPPFNPDDDTETPPQQISAFRKLLQGADAILISTPEYAIGVPGTLKNALDWTVSSMEFSKKPVALITASTMGNKAHSSLLGTLLIIESQISADTQLVISGIKAKVNSEGQITDSETLQKLNALIFSLKKIVENDESLLPTPSLKD